MGPDYFDNIFVLKSLPCFLLGQRAEKIQPFAKARQKYEAISRQFWNYAFNRELDFCAGEFISRRGLTLAALIRYNVWAHLENLSLNGCSLRRSGHLSREDALFASVATLAERSYPTLTIIAVGQTIFACPNPKQKKFSRTFRMEFHSANLNHCFCSLKMPALQRRRTREVARPEA